ncbi:MAG TPA: hypothetical protein VMF30_06385 [Pirellulales bacterium]|nr:hypothetical protein [Pirellulales bacterium]
MPLSVPHESRPGVVDNFSTAISTDGLTPAARWQVACHGVGKVCEIGTVEPLARGFVAPALVDFIQTSKIPEADFARNRASSRGVVGGPAKVCYHVAVGRLTPAAFGAEDGAARSRMFQADWAAKRPRLWRRLMVRSAEAAAQEAKLAELKQLIRSRHYESLEKLEDAVDALLWGDSDVAQMTANLDVDHQNGLSGSPKRPR